MFKRKVRETVGRRAVDGYRPGIPVELLYYMFVAGVLVGILWARRNAE